MKKSTKIMGCLKTSLVKIGPLLISKNTKTTVEKTKNLNVKTGSSVVSE